MTLPNAERAFIDEAKLETYCLSTEHGRGRDKARVSRATLNLEPGDGPALAALLRQRITADDLDEVENGEYGVIYVCTTRSSVLHLLGRFAMCGSFATARTFRGRYQAIW